MLGALLKSVGLRRGRGTGGVSIILLIKYCSLICFAGPRSRLQELQQTAKSKHDLEFLMGVEVEFQLMKPATESTPAQQVQTSSHPYSTASLRNAYLPVLEEIVSSLVKAGVQIRQFHGEGARGFFEITGEPLAPLEAADTLVFMQETIRSVCSNRGLHATLFPKPL